MSQEPTILLVDLAERSASIAQALARVGRPAMVIDVDEVAAAFEHARPLAIVVHAIHVRQVADQMRAARPTYRVPVFALTKDTPGSTKFPLAEVTACVPQDIDPGILSLRLQKALQQAGSPRARQDTVFGLGDGSGRTSRPPPPASASASTRAPAPSDPPGSDIVSSAPPLAPPPTGTPSQPPNSAVSRGVVSSAPPLPSLSAPKPAALPTFPTEPAAPLDAPPNPGASPSHPPVALAEAATSSDQETDVDELLLAARTKRQRLRRGMAAAGLVAVLGVGAAVLLGGSEGDTDTVAEASATDAAAVASTQAASKIGKEGAQPTTEEVDQSKDAAGAAPSSANAPGAMGNEEADASKDLAAAEVSDEGRSYRIESPISMPSCEETLGKGPEAYSSAKKWRGAQSWKFARRSLMAGKEEKALEHMCESAFIDPSGPASAGLVKFYLGRRALDRAHEWAQRALESATAGASKREAQQLLADELNQQGKIEEARKLWLGSFNLTADQTDRLASVCRNFVSAALTARKGGDSPLAERLLRRAAAFEPDNAVTAALLASVLLQNEQKGLAKIWAQRALAKDAGSEIAQTVLAQVE